MCLFLQFTAEPTDCRWERVNAIFACSYYHIGQSINDGIKSTLRLFGNPSVEKIKIWISFPEGKNYLYF